MTKARFIKIHTQRGYTIEDMGKTVRISMDNYTALWFFQTNGALDETRKPMWTLSH
jgi:hypothetical protein